MGCGKSLVIENKSKTQLKESKNPQLALKSSIQKTFPMSNINNSLSTTTNKTFKLRTPQNKDEAYIYTPKSFNSIEKLFDNGIYKQFRVNNLNTNTVQMMYVISNIFKVDPEKVKCCSIIKDKQLMNINHYFNDDYFTYIISDIACINIYDAIFHFNNFTYDKLRKIIRNILNAINCVYSQNASIPVFSYKKIKVLNESFEVKLEHFDIRNLIYENEVSNPIENVLFELGKIIVVILNKEKEIEYIDYKNIDISLYYSRAALSQTLNNDICDLIEVLLSGEEKIIDNILALPYFLSQACSPYSKCIRINKTFYSFYSKYLLYTFAEKYLKHHLLCKKNSFVYLNLFDEDKNEGEAIVNEMKISKLNTNLRKKFQDKYTQYEMNEIVILFANTKMTVSSPEQFITLLARYDCSVIINSIKRAFEFLDKDKLGKIEVRLLKNIFHLHEKVCEELNEIINEVDKTDDHLISFNEFLYILIHIN